MRIPTVVIPLTLSKLPSAAPVILTAPVNVDAVLVIILSVDATPVSPAPSPAKLLAVTTPVYYALVAVV